MRPWPALWDCGAPALAALAALALALAARALARVVRRVARVVRLVGRAVRLAGRAVRLAAQVLVQWGQERVVRVVRVAPVPDSVPTNALTFCTVS